MWKMWKVLWCFILLCSADATAISGGESSQRIGGGNIAVANQFPYAISLQRIASLPNYLEAHRCGGVLINLQHSLTLATCVFVNAPNIIPVAEYRVFAGGLLLSQATADTVRNINKITVHPNFVQRTVPGNNIAIIRTVQPFLSSVVTPIQLPAVNVDTPQGVQCSVVGWGGPNSTLLISNELRYINKIISNTTVCGSVWNFDPFSANVGNSLICATSINNIESSCNGDSGNALICGSQLSGLLSSFNSCTNISSPEVFVRVSNYTTWINKELTGAGSSFRPEFGVLAIVSIFVIKIFS